MKKAILMLSLLSIAVSNMQAMQQSDQDQPSPKLVAILKKKYIDKQPLNANEAAFLKKASIVTIGTILAVLTAAATAGVLGKRSYDVDFAKRKADVKRAIDADLWFTPDEQEIDVLVNLVGYDNWKMLNCKKHMSSYCHKALNAMATKLKTGEKAAKVYKNPHVKNFISKYTGIPLGNLPIIGGSTEMSPFF